MKHVSNEQGYTFFYVLMIFAVLLIVTPVLLNISASEFLMDRKDFQSQRIEQMAQSGMESFIDYLNDYTGDTAGKAAYFNNYPAWGNKEIQLPEGGILESEFITFFIEDGVSNPYPETQQPPNFVPPESRNVGVRMKVTMRGTSLSTHIDYGITVGYDLVNDNPLISEIPIYPGTDRVITPKEIPEVPGKTAEESFDFYFDQLIPATYDYSAEGFCGPRGLEAAMLDAINNNKAQATIEVTGSQSIEAEKCPGGKGNSKGEYDYRSDNDTIFVIYIKTDEETDYSQSNGQIVYIRGMLLVDGNLHLANKADLHVDDLIVRNRLKIVNNTDITGDNVAAKQYDGGTWTEIDLDPTPNPDYNYLTNPPAGGTGGGWNPVRL